MKTQNTTEVVAATVPVAVVEAPKTALVFDPFAPEALPNNKQVQYFLDNGYALDSEFRSRNRDEAKDKAKEIRADGSKQTTYITLHGGWYGVFVKDAPERKAAAAATAVRPEIRVEIPGFSGTTKEARAFANLLREAAKNAEFDYDLAQATAKKSEAQSE